MGRLAEVVDCVFFRNFSPTAFNEAAARDVFNPMNFNVFIPGFANADSPVRVLERSAPVSISGLLQVQVIGLDPRATNEAATCATTVQSDDFLVPTSYRGAFSPTGNWLCGWSTSDSFGFLRNCNVAPIAGPPVMSGSRTVSLQ